MGKGKLEEIRAAAREQRADVMLFDSELSPRQLRNLEEALNIKILDRTALILDIFARHAHTHEGRLQVELAQLRIPPAPPDPAVDPPVAPDRRRRGGGAAAAWACAAPARRSWKWTAAGPRRASPA